MGSRLGTTLPLLVILISAATADAPRKADAPRPHVRVRGIYGGVPQQIFDRGQTLAGYGVNAVWLGSGGLSRERIALLRKQGARVYAEFNSMHEAGFLKEHPDARPIGADGKVSPPPDGWQGVCPTHPAYRSSRMAEFRSALRDFDIDGIWLDYHHAHASWEQAVPNMPDTCFCARCIDRFQRETKTALPDAPPAERAALLLGKHRRKWTKWRCDVFTDWVREYREILDSVRPRALLGTFHCPWTDRDFDGALRDKLAIDLRAQMRYLDVFSTMPYHARFGHHRDPAWVSRQTKWLGQHLGIRGIEGEKKWIWPIVQLSDWGETVPVEQVGPVLDHGTRAPSTGVMVFVWGTLHPKWERVEAMGRFYRAIQSEPGGGKP